MNNIIKYIKDNNIGNFTENENMANHCSMKIGGKIRLLVYPNSVVSLANLISVIHEEKKKYKIIGRGSNIIFPDHDLEEIFIKISNILNELEYNTDNTITVGAGYSFQKLAKKLSKEGYSGLEFAGGIPGTVGGAVYMNAGAHSGETKDVIKNVTILDENLNLRTLTKEECEFSYRHSIFQKENFIVLNATLEMKQGDKAEIFKKTTGNLEYRKEMQPLNWPSFGSVFKNPPKYHVGKLIEEAGLKGYKIGGAEISKKHANFIINTGGATASDVFQLIEHVKKVIYEKYKINLISEVEIYKG